MDSFISPRRFAELADLTPRSVVQLIRRGELRGAVKTKTGRWRVPTSALLKYLDLDTPIYVDRVRRQPTMWLAPAKAAKPVLVVSRTRLEDPFITPLAFARRANLKPRFVKRLLESHLIIGARVNTFGKWEMPMSSVSRYLQGERPEGTTIETY